MKTGLATQSIQVKQPCKENYDNMQNAGEGKFCGSCNHIVHDFTEWSNQQIVEYITSQEGKVCGMFRNEQLQKPKQRWASAIKVSLIAALALWFSKGELKAQKPKADTVLNANVITDSVVVVVRGQIKSEGKTVYRSVIEARDSSGNVIAKTNSYSGKFELHVPVAYPKQAFTIVVTSKGYKKEVIENYVSSAGNVLGIEMSRRLFGKPSKPIRTLGCPSF